MMMNNDFELYMLEKIEASFFPAEREMNEAILSLYQKGYLDVKMDGDKPMLSISKTGENVYMQLLLSSMTPMGEA
tara:strand:+ start:1840 stop:2064 length:225 start_codon:yes stop_codon:yes gene_type:complete